MTLGRSILLGILQGLCEFLPISSSGHLALAHSLFGLSAGENALAFDVLLHVGTLGAVVILFYKDIFLLITSFFTLLGKLFRGRFSWKALTVGERFVIFMVLAMLPMIPAAFLSDRIEALMAYPALVGGLLLINGGMLLWSEGLKGDKALEDIRPKNAFCVGLFQLLAVVPGISRSGSTITGGLTQGFDRTLAVRFSFLLSIPAIAGASLLKLPAFVSSIPDSRTLWICLAGAFTAFVVGILAIQLVRLIARRGSFRLFAFYCFALGAGVLLHSLFF